MKNHIELIQELQIELIRLENPSYRREQQVWAEDKQLKNIRHHLHSCMNGVGKIGDFCRLVSDCAPTNARISILAGQLYEGKKVKGA